MPRSTTLLIVGILAALAAIAGGLVGAHKLLRDSGDPPPVRATSGETDAPPARVAAARWKAKGVRPAPAKLPAAALHVAPGGADGGPCSAEKPCGTFDAAYHAAKPGQLVEIAGGRYGDQVLTPRDDGGLGARGCESAAALRACVVLAPARGARVVVENFTLGADYAKPGPAGVAVVADRSRVLETASTNLTRADEVALYGVRMRNLYISGGRDIGVRGGSVGGSVSPDGLHPEIQRVYRSDPVIVPKRLTIEGVRFHDINTTSPTAHVDCLQIENGEDLVIRGNTFERCGSVGLRMSYGADGYAAPPRHVLIEGNHFGACAKTPVSNCYYAAQLGVGHDVVVRGNTATQMLQQAGDAQYARNVRYERNMAPGLACDEGVRYVGNTWAEGTCSGSDREVGSKRLAAALRRAAPAGSRLDG